MGRLKLYLRYGHLINDRYGAYDCTEFSEDIIIYMILKH